MKEENMIAQKLITVGENENTAVFAHLVSVPLLV